MCVNDICSRRAVISGATAVIGTFILPHTANSQRLLTIKSSAACNMCATVQTTEQELAIFDPSAEARQVIKEICGAIALPQNFIIYSVNDSKINAEARMIDGRRLIIYNEIFMKGIAAEQSRDWSGLTVMAHEIGHHLCGHTLDNKGSLPPRELEADYFAGNVVRVLGGALANATKAFECVSEQGSSTHPPRGARIAAFAAGWNKANGQNADERHALITHNEKNGKFIDIISEFVGRDRNWIEYQHGEDIGAKFREIARVGPSILLYDKGRSIWLKIDVDPKAGLAIGSWNRGPLTEAPPSTWIPLDPRKWK